MLEPVPPVAKPALYIQPMPAIIMAKTIVIMLPVVSLVMAGPANLLPLPHLLLLVATGTVIYPIPATVGKIIMWLNLAAMVPTTKPVIPHNVR